MPPPRAQNFRVGKWNCGWECANKMFLMLDFKFILIHIRAKAMSVTAVRSILAPNFFVLFIGYRTLALAIPPRVVL